MSEIICDECGKLIGTHPLAFVNQVNAHYIGCLLTQDVVELRHQLKQMTAECDALKVKLDLANNKHIPRLTMEVNELVGECDALQKKLDVAIGYIQYDADMTSHITRSSMAKGTLAKIERIGKENGTNLTIDDEDGNGFLEHFEALETNPYGE